MSADNSEFYIRSLDEQLQPYAIYLVNAARSVGVPLVVISGRRSAELNKQVGGAPQSLHLEGLAFDVAVMGYLTQDIPADWWRALGMFGEALGLRWGGRFDDPNHFDVGRGFVIG